MMDLDFWDCFGRKKKNSVLYPNKYGSSVLCQATQRLDITLRNSISFINFNNHLQVADNIYIPCVGIRNIQLYNHAKTYVVCHPVSGYPPIKSHLSCSTICLSMKIPFICMFNGACALKEDLT